MEGGIVKVSGDRRVAMSTKWIHDHIFDFICQRVSNENVSMMNTDLAIRSGEVKLKAGVATDREFLRIGQVVQWIEGL